MDAEGFIPPKLFLCPISQDVMKDPVLTTAFQTYERESIEKWFALGHRTDPITGQWTPRSLYYSQPSNSLLF